MDRTLPSATRRWAGTVSLPLFFLAMIAASVSDPVEDETATPAGQLHQAAAHLGRLHAAVLFELLGAVLFLAATMAIVGAVRGRGSGLANAGAVLGVLGGVGLAMIGVNHIFMYALAASGTSDGLAVLAARDRAAGPLPLLFFAAPFAIVVLCVAAFRSGLVPWPLLVVVGAFLVLEYVPSPLGEVPSLVAGLVAYAWIAVALVTGGRREGGAAETPDRAAAAVS
jgi:hypothetical protein